MFCSGCGQEIEAGRASCPKCGWTPAPVPPPMTPPLAPMPGFEFELARYAGKVRVLGTLWLVWAGLSLLFGFAAMSFLRAFLSGAFGFWEHDQPNFPNWFGPAIIHFVWVMLCLHTIICAIAGWGLLERTQWGRVMAIIVAVISLFHGPLGIAIGIATLVILLGYRNSMLYDSL